MYNFKDQYTWGRIGEERIFRALEEQGWDVEEVEDKLLQVKGLDAFIARGDDRYSIEIKTDLKAHKTGNVFLEREIVGPFGRVAGYLYKTCAQVILYHTPPNALVPALNALALRAMIQDWSDGVLDVNIKKYDGVQNDGWAGNGYLVPQEVAVKYAWEWNLFL